MIEIFIAFLAGALAGYWARPKTPELEQQKAIYDKKIIQYEIDIAYYKELCKWHVRHKEAGGYDQKETA